MLKIAKSIFNSIEIEPYLGYRTLCFASADLNPADYEKWSREFKEATNSIKDRERKIGNVAEKIEQNLRLVGITAIEDKLQEVSRKLHFYANILTNKFSECSADHSDFVGSRNSDLDVDRGQVGDGRANCSIIFAYFKGN